MGITKNIAVAGAGIASLFGGSYLYNLYQLSQKILIDTKILSPNKNSEGVSLTITVVIKNPTDTNLNIKYPFVKLETGDEKEPDVLGSSIPSEEIISIPANGQTDPFNLEIQIPAQAVVAALGFGVFNFLTPNSTTSRTIPIRAITRTGMPYLFETRSFSFEDVTETTIKL